MILRVQSYISTLHITITRKGYKQYTTRQKVSLESWAASVMLSAKLAGKEMVFLRSCLAPAAGAGLLEGAGAGLDRRSNFIILDLKESSQLPVPVSLLLVTSLLRRLQLRSWWWGEAGLLTLTCSRWEAEADLVARLE